MAEGCLSMMRIDPCLEPCRERHGCFGSNPGDLFGAFAIKGPAKAMLQIVAASGAEPIVEKWEHVSVSVKWRCPTWEEMLFVKSLFWDDDDCVVQFHPPKAHYINTFKFCLHLWCWRGGLFPMPPKVTV